jgi:hypothetical protein
MDIGTTRFDDDRIDDLEEVEPIADDGVGPALEFASKRG